MSHNHKPTLKSVMKQLIIKFVPNKIIVFQMKNQPRSIALTFDDGPSEKTTPKVLKLLKENNIKATFFLIGQRIVNNPELTKQIIEEGHCVGGHSSTHEGFQSLNFSSKKEEILEGQRILNAYLKERSCLYRPPRGILSLRQLLFCIGKGLTTVMWSQDSLDHKNKGKDFVLDRIKNMPLKGGDILLLHDASEYTHEALPEIIQHIRARGLKFCTIREAL